MERGIAALRASWTTQILIEFNDICPGNLKELETVESIDKGCVFENYGHSGRDERNRGFINLDWGNGSAAYATAYAKKHFGDLFIDFKEKFIFGIDGILIKKFDFLEGKVLVEFELIPNKEIILIKSRDPPEQEVEIIINNHAIGIFDSITLEKGFKYTVESKVKI